MSGIDPGKLAEWFGDRAPGLVLYARQWLDPAAAEDVVQEVFVRLMAQPCEPANLKAWLYLATRNAAIGAGRSGRRRLRRERAVAERRGAELEPLFHSSPEDRIDAAAAEAALAGLPEPQREIVLLRIWGGMTLAEVASVTGLALSTVYDHYRAALARVRTILESSCQTRTNQPPAPARRAPNPQRTPAGPPDGPITGAFRATWPT
jgi:RNA polymerase sigma factor (sigma-70 family)